MRWSEGEIGDTLRRVGGRCEEENEGGDWTFKEERLVLRLLQWLYVLGNEQESTPEHGHHQALDKIFNLQF